MTNNKQESRDEQAILAFRAGLGYGPAYDPTELSAAIVAAKQHTEDVTLTLPQVLVEYFKVEAERLGMSESELIVRILETHRFTDQNKQHLILAIERKRACGGATSY
jgi:hypothetical protein